MFVYNVKVNGSKIYKVFFSAMVIFLVIIVCIVTFKIFSGASNSESNDTCIPRNHIAKLTTNNYTNVLKVVHENIDNYVGMKINFTGYVYRVIDLKETQFILARDMIISSDRQSVIVGFLCECNTAKDFSDNSWVEITR